MFFFNMQSKTNTMAVQKAIVLKHRSVTFVMYFWVNSTLFHLYHGRTLQPCVSKSGPACPKPSSPAHKTKAIQNCCPFISLDKYIGKFRAYVTKISLIKKSMCLFSTNTDRRIGWSFLCKSSCLLCLMHL